MKSALARDCYDLTAYRQKEAERAREASLLSMLPANRRSAIDVGARDGHYSRLLAQRYEEVTALDLIEPEWSIPGVRTVAGNAVRLNFPDDSFDVVLCTEVLEHIVEVERAASELVRIARHEIIIGVPFDQDLRVGRSTCQNCGHINPPWGHVNSFTEGRLLSLFPDTRLIQKEFVGEAGGRSNILSGWLMDLGGNPWGVYTAEEPCLRCGATLRPPASTSLGQKVCAKTAHLLNQAQCAFSLRKRPNWIHVLLEKI